MYLTHIGPLVVMNVGDWTAIVAPGKAALLSAVTGYTALLLVTPYIANRRQAKPDAAAWARNQQAWTPRRLSGWTVEAIISTLSSPFK